jgi:serine/threonine protein kinase
MPVRPEADLERLFHGARLLRGQERERYLERETRGDPALLERLRAMLAADEDDTTPALRKGVRTDEPEAERIGRYRLLKVLGEGGMGTVHLAEQEEPVRRLVALKVVRIGRNTADVAARFQAERQALALMDHPGIARIFDGGVSESGLPYFAMEYVPGRTLDEHCDERRLSLDARLALFVKVCEAVQHAHQKGVIHRDLKSSNVLVVEHEGEAQPKVIDFGIARALAGSLAGESLAEAQVRVVGTRFFMSPEQARGEDVDTRSDVFGLGVMLYRLTAGVWPFDSERLAALPPAEYARMLQEVPPAPSTRVAHLGERAQQVAEARGTQPAELVSALHGDLDWIIARALARERAQRYAAASELAADIERHLSDEPVEAAPRRRGYRLRKFVRRHRVGVELTTALALIVAASLATIGWLLGQRSSLRGERAQARGQAGYQAERALGIADYLELAIEDRMLAAEPGVVPTVAELFRDPLPDLEERFGDKPVVLAGVLTAVSRMLLDLGENKKALDLLTRAEIRQRERPELGPYDRFETLDALITASRRVYGPDKAQPYVAPALAAAREVLADLDAGKAAALEKLLSYQAGGDVSGPELLAGLDVLLDALPERFERRDPRTHSIGRVAFEVASHMVERGSPDLGEYLRLLEDRAKEMLGEKSFLWVHCLWAVTRQLVLDERAPRELARAHADSLAKAVEILPADHWLRRESEELLVKATESEGSAR